MLGWLARIWPPAEPLHGINCSALFETPPCQKHLQSSYATKTAGDAGLRITVFPAANAAAIPPQGMAIGKFHGGITATAPFPRALTAGSSARKTADAG